MPLRHIGAGRIAWAAIFTKRENVLAIVDQARARLRLMVLGGHR